MIIAFNAANGVVRGRSRQKKSNEITAIPELLKLLNLHGCLVTIDAMGCQKKITLVILNQGADYLPAVKANQPMLADAFTVHFPFHKVDTYEGDSYSIQENSHGRLKRLGVVVSFRQEGDQIPENATVLHHFQRPECTRTGRCITPALVY